MKMNAIMKLFQCHRKHGHKCLVLQFMKMPLDSTEKISQHQIFSDLKLEETSEKTKNNRVKTKQN